MVLFDGTMVIDCVFPALSSSRGSEGSAPGTEVWEGVMIRRAARNCSIFSAVSRRGASAPRTLPYGRKIVEGR